MHTTENTEDVRPPATAPHTGGRLVLRPTDPHPADPSRRRHARRTTLRQLACRCGYGRGSCEQNSSAAARSALRRASRSDVADASVEVGRDKSASVTDRAAPWPHHPFGNDRWRRVCVATGRSGHAATVLGSAAHAVPPQLGQKSKCGPGSHAGHCTARASSERSRSAAPHDKQAIACSSTSSLRDEAVTARTRSRRPVPGSPPRPAAPCTSIPHRTGTASAASLRLPTGGA